MGARMRAGVTYVESTSGVHEASTKASYCRWRLMSLGVAACP